MVAITYQMSAGVAGDVNRTHPVDINPERIESATPPTLYGQPVILSVNQAMRPFTAGDTAQAPWGFTARPFPFNQQTTTQAYGASGFGSPTPPAAGLIDIMRRGYMMANLPAGGTPVKGGQVYVWTAASSAPHVQGAIEATNPGASGVALTGVVFNGTSDANGNVEIAVNI